MECCDLIHATGRILVILALSLVVLGACLVTVHSAEGCEAAEAPSPVGLQPSPGLAACAVSPCPDGLRFVIDGVVYGALGNGSAEVLGFEGYPSMDLVVPREVTSPDGTEHVVVRIADDAFRDMAVVESVVIPDTVTEIGRNAFSGCVSLTVLTVPVTVGCHHGDGGYAFKDVMLEELTLTRGVDGPSGEGNGFWSPMVSMLRVLVVDEGITSFTTSFRGSTHLESVVLKDVESIGEDQFRDCRSLLTVSAPEARMVDDNAFMDCPRLNRVDLSSLESLARGAFVHCSCLRTVVSDKLLMDGGQLFMILDDDSVSLIQQLDTDPVLIVIPVEVASPSGRNYTVTEIGKEAFREHGNLRMLVIYGDVRKVDEHAFHDCRSLDLITIPIGTDCSYDTDKTAFEGVKPKRLVLTSEGYDPEGYRDNEFWKPFSGSLEGLVVAEGITDFDTSFKGGKLTTLIMEEVEAVHDGQFKDCDNLVIASFPEATTIGKSAFKDCDSLVAVDASEARHIGGEAFSGCYALGDFIGDSVETVGEGGFYGCVPLAEFNFDNIKKVGPRAFCDTAVANAPASKSHCFSENSFGSMLNNALKFIFKQKWALITAGLSAGLSIAAIKISKISARKLVLLHEDWELYSFLKRAKKNEIHLMNLDIKFWDSVVAERERNKIDIIKNQILEQKKILEAEAKLIDGKLQDINKWSKIWKGVVIVIVVCAVVCFGLSVYLWDKDT